MVFKNLLVENPDVSKSIYLATYNVGTNNPHDLCLRDLLSLPVLSDTEKNENLPDFYVIGLQEVKSQPQNRLFDAIFDDTWTFCLRMALNQRDYVKLKFVRLQGLVLSVFCLRKHVLNVRDIEAEHTRTGLGGTWGNKGAVSIRLNIYGCSICFVNAHLTAHEYNLKDREADYDNIIKDHEFHVEETSKILDHDYVFWLGDLNFRLSSEYERTSEEIERSIMKKDLDTLFEQDELRHIMTRGRAFSEFTEQDPDFAPTFKFKVGTNNYDHKRKPAWCDRILHCVNSNKYENVTLKVDQLSYKSHPFYTLSDHKPVSAEFIIKTPRPIIPTLYDGISNETDSDQEDQAFSPNSEHVVQFDKISSWIRGQDNNKAYYKFTKEIPAAKEDWIGLFRINFGSLEEYVTYEYVSKCATPTEEQPEKFELTMPGVPRSSRGDYYLVYFSQTEDKIMSVLGISDLFPIVKPE